MKEDEKDQNNSNVAYCLIPKKWMQLIEENQQKILNLLGVENNEPDSIGDYIMEKEAKKLLGRKTTWFWKMRSSGQLPFSKIGNKVFYRKTDILNVLERNQQR